MLGNHQSPAGIITNSVGGNKNGAIRGSNGKFVGRVKGEVYEKNISFGNHILRMFGGSIGFDYSIVENTIKPLCKRIEVKDKDSLKIYRVTVNEFLIHKIDKNLGHGPQSFLPLSFWHLIGENEHPELFGVH